MGDYRIFRAKMLKNKEVKKAYDELGPEFALIETLIRKRLARGMTQKQLAKKLGTKQPVISRLEGGTYNPTVKFLRRVATALGAELVVKMN